MIRCDGKLPCNPCSNSSGAAPGFPDTFFSCNDATGGVRWQVECSAGEFKLEAVKLVRERGVAAAQASRNLGKAR